MLGNQRSFYIKSTQRFKVTGCNDHCLKTLDGWEMIDHKIGGFLMVTLDDYFIDTVAVFNTSTTFTIIVRSTVQVKL